MRQREADALAVQIYAQDFDQDLLLEGDYLCGVLDELAGSQLRDVNKAFYMYSYINKGSKVGDVAYYAWQFHTGFDILNGMNLI